MESASSMYLYVKFNWNAYSFFPTESKDGDSASYEKKEEIWLSSVTKAHTPTEKSKKKRDNIKNATKTSII